MKQIVTIHITGDDALEFLQGQLTNDLERLESEAEILSAWCSPKGRVIWFDAVAKTAAGYALTAPAETAEEIVKRLAVYRFRAKVDFTIADEGDAVDAESLIAAGRAYIGTEQIEQFTPHMLNLDILDAISLDKGCYTGQEIVARTHYKGATKRRTLRFTSSETVVAGDKISDGKRDIGEVLNAAGQQLLAVIAVDKQHDPLAVGTATLQPAELPYSL